MRITICESCKIELSKIGLSPDLNSCRNCGNNPKNKPDPEFTLAEIEAMDGE